MLNMQSLEEISLADSTVNLLLKESDHTEDSNITVIKTSKCGFKLKLVIAFCVIIFTIGLVFSVYTIIKKSEDPVDGVNFSQITEQMLERMNLDVDPCVDFYQYACGGYDKNRNQRPGRRGKSIIQDAVKEISSKIKGLLEQSDEHDGVLQGSSAIRKARRYYKACMRNDYYGGYGLHSLINDIGGWQVPLISNDEFYYYTSLKSIARNFREAISNTCKMGDFKVGNNLQDLMNNIVRNSLVPNKKDRSNNALNSNDWNFQEALSKALEFSDPLLDVQLKRNQKNSSEYIIYVDQAGLLFPSHHYIASERKLSASRDTYTQHFKDTCQQLGARGSLLEKLAEKVWQFEQTLGEVFEPRDRMVDPNKLYNLMTVEEFQKILDVNNGKHVINIQTLLSKQMKRSVSLTDTIVVQVPDYFRKMALLVNNTDTETLSSYIIWCMVRELSPHAGGSFLETHNQLARKLYGEAEDTQDWERCVQKTESAMEFATAALYVQKYFSAEDRKIISNMMKLIMKEFSAIVKRTEWMTEKVKKAAIEKLNNLRVHIGYPDFILNQSELDDFYDDMYVDDDALLNRIDYSSFQLKRNYAKFGTVPDKNAWDVWDVKPTEVNAFNQESSNQVFIPVGILQPPFYSRHMPASFIFGAIGSVLGHELTHGFDPSGSRYGPSGELLNWWDQESRDQFDSRSQCFVNEYNSFSGTSQTGRFTLDENVADNGGVDMAYSAGLKTFQGHIDKTEITMNSSFLLNLTSGQHFDPLFFIAYAQTYCDSYTEEEESEISYYDPHSKDKYRVLGVVRNMPEFSKAFSCATNAPMNPQTRCKLW